MHLECARKHMTRLVMFLRWPRRVPCEKSCCWTNKAFLHGPNIRVPGIKLLIIVVCNIYFCSSITQGGVWLCAASISWGMAACSKWLKSLCFSVVQRNKKKLAKYSILFARCGNTDWDKPFMDCLFIGKVVADEPDALQRNSHSTVNVGNL